MMRYGRRCKPVIHGTILLTLLGALDIAITRQNDHRYEELAEEAVLTLIQGNYDRPDGVDVYELMPVFAELVLNRINVLENGAVRPPFWKRMCAWMQAGLLTRFTESRGVDIERFRKWSLGVQTPAGVYAKLLDLRQEPMFRASEMSRSALYEEVIGRLVVLRNRHEAAGRKVPCANEIEKAVAEISQKGSPLGWIMPGPLEGHGRPSDLRGRSFVGK